MIHVQDIVGGYNERKIIRGVHLNVKKGEFFALLGPNGSGKTTLFKLITGQLPAEQGMVELDGQSLAKLSKLEKAKKMAVLTQEATATFDYTVEEIVALGRYPHQTGFLKILSTYDRKVIKEAMEMTHVESFQHARFKTLSGGEKQRVLLAKALAQEPEILLLDEPTNHLDIHHTFQLLDQLKEWQQTKKLTIFAILHDLNVASLYADRIALLHKGMLLEVGDVYTLRKEEQLKKVYNVEVKTQSHPTLPNPQLLMTPDYTANSHKRRLKDILHVKESSHSIHMQFDEPLRTLSNSLIGEGIQWLSHYFIVHGGWTSNCLAHRKQLRTRMIEENIPLEKAAGFMTLGHFNESVWIEKNLDPSELLVFVLGEWTTDRRLNNLLIIVIVDEYIEDHTLLNCYKSAIEGKGIAIDEDQITVANQSNDQLVIACRQQKTKGKQDSDHSYLQQAVKQAVYEAMKQVWMDEGVRE